MTKHMNMKDLSLILTMTAAILIGGIGGAFAQKGKKANQVPYYKTIPSASFLTINAEYLGGYRPDPYFSSQVPAFGFKAGTMRNVGWFVGAMSNFNFKGTFVTCDPSEICEDVTSSSYFEALVGITLRYWHPLSFHFGLGYNYRSFNNQTIYGQWAHIPNHTAQGPMATAGFMFHLGGFVVSAEAMTGYNVQGLRNAQYKVDKTRLNFGGKVGLGVCIPYKYRSDFTPRNQQADVTPVPYAAPAPTTAPVTVPLSVEQPVQPVTSKVKTTQTVPVQATTVMAEPAPVVEKAAVLTVTTLPVTQLNPGWITVSGEATGDGIEPVIERGICWGTTPYPTLTGAHTSDGYGDGFFTTVIPNLQPGTLYYFRAYAGTRAGVRYGNTVSVTVPNLPKQSATPQPPVTPPAPMVPQPQVAPQPQMAPQPQPVPQPQMVPQPQTTPQPQVAPQPQMAPQPQTAPQPQMAPQPQPVQQPQMDQQPQVDQQPQIEPESNTTDGQQ